MGSEAILEKVRGAQLHGGGIQLTPDAYGYRVLKEFLEEVAGLQPTSPTPANVALESAKTTYRRASLLLTGKVPQTYPSLTTEAELAQALDNLMEHTEFYDYIKRAANDRLLTRSINSTFSLDFYMANYYPMYAAIMATDPRNSEYVKAVSREIGESALELIAYVVKKNRPYTEILTADYTMVGANTAAIFETNLSPQAGEFLPAKDEGQLVSATQNQLPSSNWDATNKAFAEPVGLLNNLGFLQQYQTNATNRNRARARWTLQHFLGIDIENSSSRNIDASVLIDVQGGIPTRLACKVCHDRIDPVAGAFQRYGPRGMYLDGAFGIDTLDNNYKRTAFYQPGDTWYKSMLAPGFEGVTFDLSNLIQDRDPLRQLAEQIVQHPKFAEGTVKFWWPSLFADEILPYQLTGAELALRQSSLQEFSAQFSNDGYNFKHLVRAIMLSPYFRSLPATDNPYKQSRRLLTPEELHNKTQSLAQFTDARLLNDWLIIYGGIDSYNVEQRQRQFSPMMYQVAKQHAADASCQLVNNLRADTNKSALTQPQQTSQTLKIAGNTAADIQITTTDHQQLLLKNNNLSSAPITIKFIPSNGTELEFEPITLGANAAWNSLLQATAGTWQITNASPEQIDLTATSISLNTEIIRAYLSELAFDFWGETQETSVDELLAFYWAARQVQDKNLIDTCNLTSNKADETSAELASWRMVFIRLMTDYNYLYE